MNKELTSLRTVVKNVLNIMGTCLAWSRSEKLQKHKEVCRFCFSAIEIFAEKRCNIFLAEMWIRWSFSFHYITMVIWYKPICIRKWNLQSFLWYIWSNQTSVSKWNLSSSLMSWLRPLSAPSPRQDKAKKATRRGTIFSFFSRISKEISRILTDLPWHGMIFLLRE